MKTCTCYYFKFFKSYVGVFCDLISYLLQHASFLSDSVAKEMGPIVSELAMRESPVQSELAEHTRKLLTGPSSFFQPVIGTRATLTRIARCGKSGKPNPVLNAYFKETYMKSNFAFLCVGDVDAGVKEEVRACALYRAENPFEANGVLIEREELEGGLMFGQWRTSV